MQDLKASLNKITGSSRFITLSKNYFWLFSDKGLKIISEVFIGAWIARFLGPEHFGIFNYGIAYAVMFSAFAKFGINSTLVRDLVKYPNQTGALMGTAFIIKIISSSIAFTILITITYLSHQDDLLKMLTVGLVAVSILSYPLENLELYFQAKTKSRYAVISRNIVILIFILVKVFLIINEFPLYFFALVYSLELIMGYVVIFFSYSKFEPLKKLRFSKKIALSFINDSWPLIFSSLFVSIYMRIDQIMLQYLSTERALGYYAASTRIVEAWNFIPMVIVAGLLPEIVSVKNDKHLFKRRLRQLYFILLLLAGVISVLMLILASPISSILFGEKYTGIDAIIRLQIWSILFTFIGVGTTQFLVVKNLTKYSLYRSAIGLCTNVLLNLLLIPLYNEYGAVYATLISYFIVVASLAFFKETRHQIVLILTSYKIAFTNSSKRTNQ